MASQYPSCVFHWVVFSAVGQRAQEAERSAAAFVGAKAQILVKQFRDGFMPYAGAEVKSIFEELKTDSPDLIFTHYRNDAHQDHRLISDLTWNTFRDHLILEYEIPKYDGDLGQPNFFVPLDPDICKDKIRFLMDSFESQRSKYWFREETFLSLMRLRGVECRASSEYAEAFYSRKIVL